jgi:hypothetical protein
MISHPALGSHSDQLELRGQTERVGKVMQSILARA